MPKKERTVVKEILYWSYANLAMAHAAKTERATAYTQTHYIIRSKLYSGLMKGTMKLGSMLDDEKITMKLPQCCSYCGSMSHLSIDHLIPQAKGGEHSGDKAVWACRSCNSSKQDKDLLKWFESKDTFPPVLVFRRYLKIVIAYCERNCLMEQSAVEVNDVPFCLHKIPMKYPKLDTLILWQDPVPG